MEGTLKAIPTQVIIQANDILTMEDTLISILRDKQRKFTGTIPLKCMHPDKEKSTTGMIEMIAGTTGSIAIKKARITTTTTAGIMTKTGNIKKIPPLIRGDFYMYPNIFSMLWAVCSFAYTQSISLPFLSCPTIMCFGEGMRQCLIPPYPLI